MTDRQLVTIDHDNGTITIDPDATIEPVPVSEGFRVSAEWYDGAFTTTSRSVMKAGETEFALSDILAAHLSKPREDRTYKAAEFPPRHKDD